MLFTVSGQVESKGKSTFLVSGHMWKCWFITLPSAKKKAWRKIKIFLQFTILLQNPVFMGFCFFSPLYYAFLPIWCKLCSWHVPYFFSVTLETDTSFYFIPPILHWITVLTNRFTSDLCSIFCFSKSESYFMFFSFASNSTLIVYNCRVERWLLSKELQSNLAC